MTDLFLSSLLDKIILLLVVVGVGTALAVWWLVPRPQNGQPRAGTPLMPMPSLEVSDLLLLIGVKEAQIASLQRQVEKLQDQVSRERREHPDA